MHLQNATKMQAGYTLGMAPDGGECLVAVIKGTFAIPENGGQATLHPTQEALFTSDTFTGEPGLSAPVYEADYAPEKKRCDVLLQCQAHAPNQKPVERLTVGFKVGSLSKSFDVVGQRFWDRTLLGGLKPSKPLPFLNQTLTYDCAYGGVDTPSARPEIQEMYLLNPVGMGFHPVSPRRDIEGAPLPLTEETHNPVSSPKGAYQPMAPGPIGRSWLPRYPHAGTYDQNWKDHVFPFLPADFKPDYYQAAPPDQQMNHLVGGEEVTLMNLTPAGKTCFSLPTLEVPVEFCPASGSRITLNATADTLVIEPDANRLMITWRAALALKNNIFEMKQIVVGRMPRGWYRARDSAKSWYPSISHLMDARRE